MKKILSITLSLLIVITSISFATTAFAASKFPATSITSLSAKDNGFTVKWKKKTKITGYQIQYSTSSKFSKKSTKTVKIKKAKTTSKKINDLKSLKKYYVRVRTYKNSKKKTYYSSWSKKKCIITQTSSTSKSTSTSTKSKNSINSSKSSSGCASGNHSTSIGNIGKWFSSKSELNNYYMSFVQDYNEQYLSGKMDFKTYNNKCPYVYESWNCAYCGKWTGNFYYR